MCRLQGPCVVLVCVFGAIRSPSLASGRLQGFFAAFSGIFFHFFVSPNPCMLSHSFLPSVCDLAPPRTVQLSSCPHTLTVRIANDDRPLAPSSCSLAASLLHVCSLLRASRPYLARPPWFSASSASYFSRRPDLRPQVFPFYLTRTPIGPIGPNWRSKFSFRNLTSFSVSLLHLILFSAF